MRGSAILTRKQDPTVPEKPLGGQPQCARHQADLHEASPKGLSALKGATHVCRNCVLEAQEGAPATPSRHARLGSPPPAKGPNQSDVFSHCPSSDHKQRPTGKQWTASWTKALFSATSTTVSGTLWGVLKSSAFHPTAQPRSEVQ